MYAPSEKTASSRCGDSTTTVPLRLCSMIQRSRTITIVASELLGRAGTSGAGTADSLLAVAFAWKVPDTVDRFVEHVIERASMQLVDAVVSPSEWLLEWMRYHGWPVPDSAQVIQYLREPTALDTSPPAAAGLARIRRIAFFGQLREGKGIRIFLGALNGIRPELLNDAEILFLGSENRRWPANAIIHAVPPTV